jgi:lysyl-tRNA synthetase class 2
LAETRSFFAQRQVLEVETPVLGIHTVTDPHLESFVVSDGQRVDGYLQTSPEYAMKRLLAAGSGSIYQITRAFRRGERGRLHNPEFTLLEWYRVDWDHHRLMDEVESLLRLLLAAANSGTVARPSRRVTYRQLFGDTLGLDPHRASDQDLTALVARHNGPQGLERDGLLAFLLSHVVEPRLERPGLTFLHDFPATQAALARLTRDELGTTVAARFEVYLDGIELANGFHELCDSREQSRRFERDLSARRRRGDRVLPVPDCRLLAALESGLPDCAGVALGFDRLLLVASGARSLDDVISFPAGPV